jgi:hypothetical protein
MKRRLRRIVNFFAFNLLFFALYLNFIHQDKAASGIPVQTVQSTTSVAGTVPVSQPEKFLQKDAVSQPEENVKTANLTIN